MRYKTALVTGGSRGLGRELVLQLARGGTTVFTVARRQRTLDSLIREAEPVEGEVIALQGDLTNRGTSKRLARRIADRGGQLDLLIHSAGLLGPRIPMADWSRQEFDEVLAANLSAPFDLTRRLLRRMDGDGLIIFISSGVTTGVRTGWGGYQVSKVAMESLAGIFAAETKSSPSESGSPRIAIVDPGAIRTEMRAAAYPEEDPETLRTAEEVAAGILARLPEFQVGESGARYR